MLTASAAFPVPALAADDARTVTPFIHPFAMPETAE